MRAAVEGLGTPYPLGTLMPAVYQEDPVAMQWTAGLDDVVAPVISVLDCLTAYTDPLLAPEDFLRWIAGWLGAVLDENWPLERRRAAVARTVALHRMTGTVAGLRMFLEVVTGSEARIEIEDSGGASWSQVPGTTPPGSAGARLTVRVSGPPGSADAALLEELIAAVKPAHVAHTLEVLES